MVRFDKPCVKVGAALNYFREHMVKRDDLSTSDMSNRSGAVKVKLLGLTGHVDERDFARVCEGIHPLSGAQLNSKKKGSVRRMCYFAQKDVSIACLVEEDERSANWWKQAVSETLGEIERSLRHEFEPEASKIRIEYPPTWWRPWSLTIAVDPQLPTNLCIMNIIFDAVAQHWKSVQPDPYYRHKGYLRDVCYNKLAKRRKDPGYILEEARLIGFNSVGFSESLREQFSKRHEEIEKTAKSLGITSQDGKQRIAVSTRAEKVVTDPESSFKMERSRWCSIGSRQRRTREFMCCYEKRSSLAVLMHHWKTPKPN